MRDCPVVETNYGKVKGQVLAKPEGSNAKCVYSYSRIPFAKPPIGELRFEPPQKAENWNGVLDATKSIPIPYQLLTSLADSIHVKVANEDYTMISEDCLYLNVFTPNTDKTASLPVLFWISGGKFQTGGSAFFNGQVLCGLKNVVLVVPNYRLNAFGFLDLGKLSKWKGNMGLQDQVMALEWTKENIQHFGGNPNNVTIFGESAGAISVGMHVISPMSRGLFHKAISHSGVASYCAMVFEDQSKTLQPMLDKLNIHETEPNLIMQKLKKLPTKAIMDAQYSDNVFFAVTFGNEFLPEHPQILLKKGNFAPVPYIIGCNNSEGYGIITDSFPSGFRDGYNKQLAEQVAKGIMTVSVKPEKIEQVWELMKQQFVQTFPADDKFRWSKIVGSGIAEMTFVAPSIEQAMVHSDKGYQTYMYWMTHKTRCGHEEEFSGGWIGKAPFCEADHADDIVFTFGKPLAKGKLEPPVKFSDEEKKLSNDWMDYLVNFAKTGNPNQGKNMKIEWPLYDGNSRQHLVVKNPFSADSNLLSDRFEFWIKTLQKI